MKIIHILRGTADLNTMNGVNGVVHHLAKEQSINGNEVNVWSITKKNVDFKNDHYEIKVFLQSKNRFKISKELYNNLNLLNSNNTVVHLHSVFIPEFFIITKILKHRNIPWVITPHGGYSPESMKKNLIIKFIYFLFFERKIILGAMKIHAVGISEVKDIKKLFNNKKIVLIPNGQDINDVKHVEVVCNEPNYLPVFGYCGRLAWKHKGLDLLIIGFSFYKKQGGPGELWIIGDGVDRKYLNDLVINLGIEKFVIFLGPLYGDIKLSYIKKMSIFIHTSRWEGMPMAVLEAAALGIPLMVSKPTNLEEYILKYNNGFVIHENSSQIISQYLWNFSEIYNKDSYKCMKTNSQNMIINELNWKIISNEITQLLYNK